MIETVTCDGGGWERAMGIAPPESAAPRSGFLDGAIDSVTFLPSTLVWGMAFGVGAAAAGLFPEQAIAMSAIVWSGTAQLAILPLVRSPIYVLFLTSLLVSLRFAPMSAVVGSVLREPSPWRRALAGCALVDASFALVMRRPVQRAALGYIGGAAVAQYLTWVLGTAVGALAGAGVPDAWHGVAEQLTILIFVILTAECALTVRGAGIALVAGALALLLGELPAHLGIPVAALLTATAGTWFVRGERGA